MGPGQIKVLQEMLVEVVIMAKRVGKELYLMLSCRRLRPNFFGIFYLVVVLEPPDKGPSELLRTV